MTKTESHAFYELPPKIRPRSSGAIVEPEWSAFERARRHRRRDQLTLALGVAAAIGVAVLAVLLTRP